MSDNSNNYIKNKKLREATVDDITELPSKYSDELVEFVKNHPNNTKLPKTPA